MTRSALLRRGIALLLLVCTSGGSLAGSDDGKEPLFGTWDVKGVLVDHRDQPHWLYRPNDPRLLSRELLVDKDRVAFTHMGRPCVAPRWSRKEETWRKLLSQQHQRTEHIGRPRIPVPGDFHLRFKAADKVVTYRLACKAAGADPPQSELDGAWFASVGKHTLVMSFGSPALLELKRRPDDAVPRPSFSCSIVESVGQKTICGSFALSELDRTLQKTLQEKLRWFPEKSSQLYGEHAEWTVRRNTCNTDEECLYLRMQEFIDFLMMN